MKDIFEFNHIDKSLNKEDIEVLKDFYSTTIRTIDVLKDVTKVIRILMTFLL